MVLDALVDGNLVQLHTGVCVPLALVGIDRVNPFGNYDLEKCRLTLMGFNNT